MITFNELIDRWEIEPDEAFFHFPRDAHPKGLLPFDELGVLILDTSFIKPSNSSHKRMIDDMFDKCLRNGEIIGFTNRDGHFRQFDLPTWPEIRKKMVNEAIERYRFDPKRVRAYEECIFPWITNKKCKLNFESMEEFIFKWLVYYLMKTKKYWEEDHRDYWEKDIYRYMIFERHIRVPVIEIKGIPGMESALMKCWKGREINIKSLYENEAQEDVFLKRIREAMKKATPGQGMQTTECQTEDADEASRQINQSPPEPLPVRPPIQEQDGNSQSEEPAPEGKIPMQSWVAKAPAESGSGEAEKYLFHKDGDTWRITYKTETFTIKHCLGLTYVKALLQKPREWVGAIQLQGSAGVNPDTIPDPDEERSIDLDEDNLHGNSEVIKAKDRVYKAINRAVENIRSQCPALGVHLANSINKRDYACQYLPEHLPVWTF